jgi:hypothetical protein
LFFMCMLDICMQLFLFNVDWDLYS